MKRLADLAGADPYPAEEPQKKDDLKPDYTVAPEVPPDDYNWVANGTHIFVSPAPHAELLNAIGVDDFARPYAYGTVTLHYRWDAVWTLEYSNMSLHLIEKRLKRYAKDQGWHYVGILDQFGQPIQSQALKQAGQKHAEYPGVGDQNPGLKNWHLDEWSEMGTFDNADTEHPVNYYGEEDYPDETPVGAPRECSDCGYLASDYNDWREHTLREHVNRDRVPPADPQAVVDLDDVLPADFNTLVMDKTVQRQSRLIFQFTAAQSQQQISGPMPFIYDIESDRIYVGHPGERHSDIQGRFTPGGIVEGLYLPDGKVQVRTDTDMPYTVRHMVELWYAMHPELEVKGIFLMVGEKRYRLASANIGHKVRNLVATNPAAWEAYKALEPVGNVFAVGGVVRDVVLRKPPKDIDLLVQGVSGEEVVEVLSQLPGKVGMTGANFGVIRYRDPHGNEVEIALPRTERSTGPGHRDFEVYTDPMLSIEDDLARRDFTGNAMAVNLSTGELVDPYRGSEDLKAQNLHAVNDMSLLEDPLRILRALVAISRHQLEPSPELLTQMSHYAKMLRQLPPERVQPELDKIFAGDDPLRALEVAQETGALAEILPEVARAEGFDQQSKYHKLPLGQHLREVLQRVSEKSDDPDLRLTALLHDIGKPDSQWFDEDGYAHYYKNSQDEGEQHEELGADLARTRLEALKYPNERVKRITHLINHHMFPAFKSQGGARKFIHRVGEEHADDLLLLRHGDSGGKGYEWDGNVPVMRQYVDRVRKAQEPTDRSMLAISGKDLVAAGMSGPEIGRVLDYLTQQVLDDPSLNDKQTLLQMARDDEHLETGRASSRRSNILDPIQERLDPAVFLRADDPDPQVRSEVTAWVRNFVYSTMKDAGWPDPKNYLRIILTGSLTTYQWSAESDFDTSLWIDATRLPSFVRSDLIALMIEKSEGVIVAGTSHPIQAFVVDTNRYVMSDLYQPGLRSAYDLDKGEWIVLPERTRALDVAKLWPEHIRYAQEVVEKFKLLLRFGNDGAVKILWDHVHRQRFLDMRKGLGDYSLSNIVYKAISNAGLVPEIAEATGERIA